MPDTRRQITRNRITYSCQNCRRRKIKCTKIHPSCDECLKTNEICTYDTDNHTPDLRRGLAETQISRKRRSVTPHTSNGGEYKSPTSNEPQIDELESILNKLSAIVLRPPSSTIQGPRDHQLSTGETHPAPLQQNEANLGDLSKVSDKLSILLDQLKSRIYQDVEARPIASGTPNQEPIDPLASSCNIESKKTTRQDLDFQYSFIPTHEQSNVLFRKWLYSIYPLMAIINPSEALIRYEAFHQWYRHGFDKGYPNPVEAFMPMVFAIHYGGIVSMSVKALRRWWPGTSRRMLLVVTQDHYMQSIRSSKSVGRSVLAAKVMMQHLCRDNLDNAQAGISLAAIVRSAQALNLHREPSPDESFPSRECDRRLWWEIVNLDIALAASSHLPPLTSEHYCDTTLPSEVKDTLGGTVEAAHYEQHLRSRQIEAHPADDPQSTTYTSMVSIYYVICRARAYLTSSMRKLIDVSTGVEAVTKEDVVQMRQTLSELELEIRAVIDRIPSVGMPEMDFTPTSRADKTLVMDHGSVYGEKLTLMEIELVLGGRPINEPYLMPHIDQSKLATVALHKWARIYLSAMIDQIYSLSYGPFMRNLKSKIWIVARQCLLKHCHSFLRKYIALATDSELQCFQWTWAAMPQPMHSSLLLLLDLYERPDSPEAARSRALIDQMLSLALVRQGVVNGEDGITSVQPLDECGREAKALLMDLRAKAWQKASLDPTVLWTEHDQIHVDVAKPPTNAELLARSMREDTVHEIHAGYSTPSQEALSSDYRQVVITAAAQMRQPSEIDLPLDKYGKLHYPQNVDETASTSRIPRLRRARDDQELTPRYNHKQWLIVPEGHITSMNDISQLLRRIKDAKLPNTEAAGETAFINGQSDNSETQRTARQPIIGLTPAVDVLSRSKRREVNDQDVAIQMAIEKVDKENAFHRLETADIAKEPQDSVVLPQSRRAIPAEHKESGQIHNQPSLSATLDTELGFEFDWEHWDSVFMSLNDEVFADILNTGDRGNDQ